MNIASGRHLLSRVGVGRQTFVQHGSHSRGANGRAHVLPIDWRPGMQDHVAPHARDDFTGWTHVDEHLLRFKDAPQRAQKRWDVTRRLPL